MFWVVLLLLMTGLALLLRWKAGQEAVAPPVDPEEAVKAAIELHAIRRRLDVALTESEMRQAGDRLRRNIRERLDDERR